MLLCHQRDTSTVDMARPSTSSNNAAQWLYTLGEETFTIKRDKKDDARENVIRNNLGVVATNSDAMADKMEALANDTRPMSEIAPEMREMLLVVCPGWRPAVVLLQRHAISVQKAQFRKRWHWHCSPSLASLQHH